MLPDGYKIDPIAGVIYGKRGKPITAHDSKGYIRINSRGRHLGAAHRIIWEFVNGAIPAGLTIDHVNGIKTDNRIANLELVTASENSIRAHRTGLANNRGSRNGRAALRECDVPAIREMINSGISQAAIGAKFGIAQKTVSDIKCGYTWRNVHDR